MNIIFRILAFVILGIIGLLVIFIEEVIEKKKNYNPNPSSTKN